MIQSKITKELKKDGDIALVIFKRVNKKVYTDWVQISSMNRTDGQEAVIQEAVRILINGINNGTPNR